MKDQNQKTKPQRDLFIEKARELGCDEDVARFNATLKRVAKAPAKEKPAASSKDQS